MATVKKVLIRDTKNKKISGVIAGLAMYLNADVNLLRVLFLFLVVFTGFFPGIFLYILAALVVPEK